MIKILGKNNRKNKAKKEIVYNCFARLNHESHQMNRMKSFENSHVS